jgi:hypothetical protein
MFQYQVVRSDRVEWYFGVPVLSGHPVHDRQGMRVLLSPNRRHLIRFNKSQNPFGIFGLYLPPWTLRLLYIPSRQAERP